MFDINTPADTVNSENKYITITELNHAIKLSLDSCPFLNNIWIIAEINSFKLYQKGSMAYLNFIDGHAQISAVMFQNTLKNLSFIPKVGQQVIFKGSVTYFHKRGTLQLQVHVMKPYGIGDEQVKLEILKHGLSKEGIFDKSSKKDLPVYPSKIAVITAKDSAAWHDFNSISEMYIPHLEIILIPAIMQGSQCPNSILIALNQAQKDNSIDSIILMRGGGSTADLAAFNDESLVRAVKASSYPVISAIGHEIDYTLTDLAADFRAETPSAAAHILAKPFLKVKTQIKEQFSYHLSRLKARYALERDTVKSQIDTGWNRLITHQNKGTMQVDEKIMQLSLLDPIKKLKQGYSITRILDLQKKNKSQILKSVTQFTKNRCLETTLIDGIIRSKIECVMQKDS